MHVPNKHSLSIYTTILKLLQLLKRKREKREYGKEEIKQPE